MDRLTSPTQTATSRTKWTEWQNATIPTKLLSALRTVTPQTTSTNLVVTWQTVTNKTYLLERSIGSGMNASFLTLASNLVGQASINAFADANVAPADPRLYRVRVQ